MHLTRVVIVFVLGAEGAALLPSPVPLGVRCEAGTGTSFTPGCCRGAFSESKKHLVNLEKMKQRLN